MNSALVFAHFLSLAVWIGGLMILLGVVTPTVVRMLSDELADVVGDQVLRSYYLIAGACAVTAAGSLVILVRLAAPPYAWPRLLLLLAMSVLTGIGAGVLQPRIDALRGSLPDFDPDSRVEQQVRQITFLRKTAVQINGLVLLLGLIALWLAVGGPAVDV